MTPTEHDPYGADEQNRTDTIEVDHEAQTPVNEVYFSDSGRQFIIEECVLCGERHGHGSQDSAVMKGGRSHRVAHCHGVDTAGGYYLELADDADPPAWWHDWVQERHGQGGDE